PLISSYLAKRQIETLRSHHGVIAFGERRDAVIEQPRRSAPHRDIAMLEAKAPRLVAPLQAAEHENRRQTERYRDNRRAEVEFILVLMQRHLRAVHVAIDQADLWRETGEAGGIGSTIGKLAKNRRHCRPRLAGFGIDGIVTIAAAIGDPARATAIGH